MSWVLFYGQFYSPTNSLYFMWETIKSLFSIILFEGTGTKLFGVKFYTRFYTFFDPFLAIESQE